MVCHCLPFLRMPWEARVIVVGAEDGGSVVDVILCGDGVVITKYWKQFFITCA